MQAINMAPTAMARSTTKTSFFGFAIATRLLPTCGDPSRDKVALLGVALLEVRYDSGYSLIRVHLGNLDGANEPALRLHTIDMQSMATP
jgi:hypothetical protein